MNLELATSRTSAGHPDHEASSTTVVPPLDDQSVRVAVSDVLFEGRLDGAWWPHSRDVTTQLPRLLAALPDRLGRITRVSLNLTMWDATPNRVQTPGRVLKVGWFTVIDPNLMALSDAEGHQTLLVVIPPETAPDVAERALTMASARAVSLTPGQLLATAAGKSAGLAARAASGTNGGHDRDR